MVYQNQSSWFNPSGMQPMMTSSYQLNASMNRYGSPPNNFYSGLSSNLYGSGNSGLNSLIAGDIANQLMNNNSRNYIQSGFDQLQQQFADRPSSSINLNLNPMMMGMGMMNPMMMGMGMMNPMMMGMGMMNPMMMGMGMMNPMMMGMNAAPFGLGGSDNSDITSMFNSMLQAVGLGNAVPASQQTVTVAANAAASQDDQIIDGMMGYLTGLMSDLAGS